MTEQEFWELSEGDSVRALGEIGTIAYFTEYGAGVTFDDGMTLNFEFDRMELVS
jgi:hypothetical protein